MPDVSLTSACHDYYLVCFAADGPCTGSGVVSGACGTSAASPSLAGIMALVFQLGLGRCRRAGRVVEYDDRVDAGVDGPVLACSGLPAGAQCVFTGSGNSATVTVSTSGTSAAAGATADADSGPPRARWLMLALAFALAAVALRRSRPRTRAAALALATAAAMASCGGSSHTTVDADNLPPTPAGTYNVIVTGPQAW